MKKQFSYWVSIGLLASAPLLTWALADVEDQGLPAPNSMDGQQYEYPASAHRLTDNQRITRLERQIKILNQQSNAQQMEQMQQTIQELRGELENATHQITELKQQQKDFYQDVNQRLAKSSTTPVAADTSQSTVTSTTTATSNTVVPDNEHEAYTQAFNLLRDKHYPQALQALQNFVQQFPAGQYTVNAYYWMGEIYYLQGKPTEAKNAFTKVVTEFPKNNKQADAWLKLAVIAIDHGNHVDAEKLLQKVQKNYPNTTASRLAGMRLQELQLSTR